MKRYIITIGASVLLVGSALAHDRHEHFAAGEPGDPSKPARSVNVVLAENPDGSMAISPRDIEVHRGEQVRFAIKNAGKLAHEFMLDSTAHNAVHKLEMRKNPEMEHDDPNGKTIDAGGTAEILWRFSTPGTFEYACLVPGHYEAGMHGIVTVKP